MPGFLRTLTSAIAGTAMFASLAIADTTTAPSASAVTPAEPLSFSTQSSAAASSLFPGPAWMLLSLTFPEGNDLGDVTGGGGLPEGMLNYNYFSGGKLEFGWELAAAGASSSAISGLTPFFVLGVMAQRNRLNYLAPSGGGQVATGNGARQEFTGVYGGLNVELFGNDSSAASSAAASSLAFNGFGWMLFSNVGYGAARVKVPNFGFYRSSEGIFYDVGTRFLFDFGLIQGGPGVSYFHYDNGPIKLEQVLFSLDFLVPL